MTLISNFMLTILVLNKQTAACASVSSVVFSRSKMLNLAVLTLMLTLALLTPAFGQIRISNSKTLSANNGGRVLLRCTSRDLSSYMGIRSLIWVKDNVTIPTMDPRLNAANGTLLIAQVRQNDAGTYTCTLEAEGFFSTSTTTVYVVGKDTPISVTSSHVTVSPPPKNILNKISTLQRKVVDLLRGQSATNVSTIIVELANLTNRENESKLKAKELSSFVEMLAQLVIYNSKMNNSAIHSTTDQQNIVQVASNLLEEEHTDTWLHLLEIRNNITDDLLKSMDEFGAQVGSRMDGLDNSKTFLTQNIVFRVDRFITRKKLSIDFSQYGAAIFVPAEVFSSNQSSIRASTIVYKTLNNVLRLRQEGHKGGNDGRTVTRFKSGSNIISATILPRPTSPMRKPIKLVFNHKNKSSDVIGNCVFWQIGLPERTWLTRGCVRVDRESNVRVTTCECDHLTIFAVLLSNKQVEAHHQPYLQYISTAGCACSLLFLLLTFMVIAFCWKHLKSPRVTMLLHLCTAIAASCILIIVIENKQLEGVWCTVTAALLHYFLLCVFTWMLCHGVMLYLLIIKAEIRDKLKPKMKWFYTLGWGFPVSIVAVSIAVSGAKSYAANNCWLTLERKLIYWAFVAPVATIIFVNSVLFVILLCRMNKVTKFRESMTRVQLVKAWLRRSAVLLPVLGVTWSFGLLTFIKSTVLFHYLFTIFNSLQGFVIFFDFCILDSDVREVIISWLCKRRHPGYINERVLEPISRNEVKRNNNLRTPTGVNRDDEQGSPRYG